MKEDIPRKTVYRLSLYNRCLERLDAASGATVSSEMLAKVAGVKPTQLRKDLAYCGQFGKRGLGYDVSHLRERLAEVLGSAKLQPVVLIGAGNLGSALLRYQGFAREGFEVVAAFDADPTRIAREAEPPVLPTGEIERFVATRGIKIAILCVPGPVAQEVCNRLLGSGIQAILNFSPIVLHVPENITVNNVNLAIELESLGYFVQ